jgi:nicotinate phosphoribosyltransferase
MPIDLRLEPAEVPLLTDLYELTVSAAFLDHGLNDAATFEVAVRRMPPNRGYMIVAGVERLLETIEEYRFEAGALEHLESLKLFKREFLDYLARFRFTGAVTAMPEGSLFFAGEPILEVHAPLIEAQLLETIVINQLNYASLVATKAARCFTAARGRRLVDFGPRRAQGADATLIAARASYLGGFHGTANVLAGKRYGIPVFGTMSHSFIMAHDGERQAFEDFAATFPHLSTLLVDTYDTIRGVENAAALAARLASSGIKVQGVRLDSGDLRELSRQSRRILDEAGCRDVAIFASGNLDEFKIADLVEAGAPIDAFGVGTALITSDDAPSADYTYKLVEYAGRPRLKTSAGKLSLPGRKQVYRASDAAGKIYADLVAVADESAQTVAREFRPAPANVVPMLSTQLDGGRRAMPRPTLLESRERALRGLESLSERNRALRRPAEYPVKLTAAMNAMVIGEKLRAEKLQD